MKTPFSKIIFISVIVFLIQVTCFNEISYAFVEKHTHPALTIESIGASDVNKYLKDQLGLGGGIKTELKMDLNNDTKGCIERIGENYKDTTKTISEWIRIGSIIEDVDMVKHQPVRSRHHFHSPIENTNDSTNANKGLNNLKDHNVYSTIFKLVTSVWGPEFDLTGDSALKWASRDTDIIGDKSPKVNMHSWECARTCFTLGITSASKIDRDLHLAKMFLDLGHVLHLMEDMGVPAHVRNDFIFGHVRSFTDRGNPFENWIEEKVKEKIEKKKNGRQLLQDWLPTNWLPTPRKFNKFASYFDSDSYAGVYLNGQMPGNLKVSGTNVALLVFI